MLDVLLTVQEDEILLLYGTTAVTNNWMGRNNREYYKQKCYFPKQHLCIVLTKIVLGVCKKKIVLGVINSLKTPSPKRLFYD
jgi:hypothetical protein